MEKNVYTYEIVENGYKILKNGKVCLFQDAPLHIPNPNLSYEENAKAQIDSLVEQEEQTQKEKTEMEQMKEEITNIQLAMLELIEGGM